jgi:MFS family permease
VFRFVAGMGIGGEYAAINSAIDELIPSKHRGRVDIAINGTYWGGAALGSAANLFLLDPDIINENWGWRIGFFIGPVLGLAIIYLRRHIPESPRWLMTHGREDEAEATVDDIEARVRADGHELEEVPQSKALEITPTERVPFKTIMGVLFKDYPRRTLVGATMMITQSFLYNAIFFTYALVLQNFYGTDPSSTQLYFFPFAIGNLLGPLLLGHLFDIWGRRRMILLTYGVSGVVLAISGLLFQADVLSATTQTVLWCVAFFFASAGASSAYLTVSELFPLEIRAQAISYRSPVPRRPRSTARSSATAPTAGRSPSATCSADSSWWWAVSSRSSSASTPSGARSKTSRGRSRSCARASTRASRSRPAG